MLDMFKVWWSSRILADIYAAEDVRVRAAEALGNLGSRRAVEPLLWSLRDPRDTPSEVRCAIVEALGKQDDPRVFDPLIFALEDCHEQVRAAATRTLIGMGRKAAPALNGALQDTGVGFPPNAKTIHAVATVLAKRGELKAVAPLTALLADEDHDIRLGAIETLAELGSRQAVPALIALMDDSDCFVREATASALGKLKDRRAVEALVTALADTDGDVRLAAAQALARIGEPQWTSLVTGEDEDFSRLAQAGHAGSPPLTEGHAAGMLAPSVESNAPDKTG